MTDRKVQLKKRIHQKQEGGLTVLVALEGQFVSESVITKLGYKVEDVAVVPAATKAVKSDDIENKAVKPASTKTTVGKAPKKSE